MKRENFVQLVIRENFVSRTFPGIRYRKWPPMALSLSQYRSLNLCKNTGQGDFGVDPELVGPGESLANSNSDRCLLLISLVRSNCSGDGGGSS